MQDLSIFPIIYPDCTPNTYEISYFAKKFEKHCQFQPFLYRSLITVTLTRFNLSQKILSVPLPIDSECTVLIALAEHHEQMLCAEHSDVQDLVLCRRVNYLNHESHTCRLPIGSYLNYSRHGP